MASLKQLGKHLDRCRAPEQEALGRDAPLQTQEVRLLAGLDALSDDFEIQCPRQPDDCRGNRDSVRIARHIHDEGAVDLEGRDREVLEVAQ